jgi:hypothetical protein
VKIPELEGLIRRRILVNYHVDPLVVQKLIPPPFEPKVHNGFAVAGICLIRLEQVRPKAMPAFMGLTSENAAHRVAVIWRDGDGAHEGVYIPRRDSNSCINQLLGGRVFPGEHNQATFVVIDDGDSVALDAHATDNSMSISVRGKHAESLPKKSVFKDMDEASNFFKVGSLGYSATSHKDHLDGLTLETKEWKVVPFAVESVSSSYFSDEQLFPSGSFEFDCALIMRNIEHCWKSAPELSTASCGNCNSAQPL